MPPQWWLKAKARPVHRSYSEFMNLIKGECKSKVVFIDFYMEYCKYCYLCLKDFNSAMDDMLQLYGEENLCFLKVDGQKISQIASRYNVHSYPKFIGVEPGGTEGGKI
jgi:thiol-disulfide isomerase/thioredoxin